MISNFRLLAGVAASLSVFALAFSGTAAKAQTAYALANGGASLFSFSVADTGSIATTTVGSFSGGIVLAAIDFRPSTGVLYGYSDGNDTVYSIDLITAALTEIPATNTVTGTSTDEVGIDFNPTTGGGLAAQFRIVSSADENRVFNVTNGQFTQAGITPLTASSTVVENAYTNNLRGALATQQYVIDAANNTLSTLANNTGVVAAVGGLGETVDADNVGFDIFTTAGGANTAYLLLGNNLHTVNTATGDASDVLGTLAGVSDVRSLAVVPVVIPEAGTLPMFLGAGLSVLGTVVIRRRNKK